MKHGNDPEARAEYSERFGDPQQQGFHETYMRPQPCAAPVNDPYQPLFDYLHDEMGVLALQTDMQEIIQICLEINAEASGRRDKAAFAGTDCCNFCRYNPCAFDENKHDGEMR